MQGQSSTTRVEPTVPRPTTLRTWSPPWPLRAARTNRTSHASPPREAPGAPGRKDDPPVLPGSRLAPATPRSGAVLLIAAALGSAALGGCPAGQIAQTAYQANGSGGATVNINGL